jgi:hypothetical protein
MDQALHEGLVAHHIQLEPERMAIGVLGDVLQRADAHGGQRERHAKGLGLGSKNLAIGMLHARQARGRNRHRHGDLLADHGGARAAPFHVHGHTLTQLDGLELVFVGPIRALGVRARIGVVIEHARHTTLGHHTQVFDTGDFGKIAHDF